MGFRTTSPFRLDQPTKDGWGGCKTDDVDWEIGHGGWVGWTGGVDPSWDEGTYMTKT